MSIIGTAESLWRYPVKSMRGEELKELFASYAGVYGDRLFAFVNRAGRESFPWFTGRDNRSMITYRPRFRYPEKSAYPPNYLAAENNPPGANPLSATPDELMIDVETPDGKTFSIEDPGLIEHLLEDVEADQELTLVRSDKAMTDSRPLSLFAIQTAHELGKEAGIAVDRRRFRANVYLDLGGAEGFAENALVGKTLRIGAKVEVSVLERDPRCMMVTLDPDTAEKSPIILKAIAQAHQGDAGLYGAILREGMIRKGDPVELLSS